MLLEQLPCQGIKFEKIAVVIASATVKLLKLLTRWLSLTHTPTCGQAEELFCCKW